LSVAHAARLLRTHRQALESLLIAFSAVTIGVSQVLYNLIVNNPQHLPPSGLFFIYVMATVQLFPILLVVGIDLLTRRLFGNNWVFRGWRTLLYIFVFISVVRQAQFLSLEPIRTLVLVLADKNELVWLLLGLAIVVVFWYAYRPLTSFFAYLTLLALVLTGGFVYQAGLLGSAWADRAVSDGGVVGNVTEVDSSEMPPIFIIMWDELEYHQIVKDGLLDAQFVPNFAALAEDSAWFTNAYTFKRETGPVIRTFLAGTTNWVEAPILFERLGKYYRMHIYEEKVVLARQFGCVHAAFTCRGGLYSHTHFPLFTARWAVLQTENLLVPARVSVFIGHIPNSYEPQISRLIDDIRTSAGPGELYFWHVLLPHSPYVFNPDGTKHAPGRTMEEDYRKQIQFTDLLLGRFVDTLKTEGLYDKSIIVVTADHGLAWGRSLVPLIIHVPGRRPMISDQEVNHVDFVPTLLDILDIPLGADERLEGKSVFAGE